MNLDLMTIAVTVLTALVGVAVTILIAAIPWAMRVHGRLVAIETKVKIAGQVPRKVSRLGRAISEQKTNITVLQERVRALEERSCDCEQGE